MLILQNQEAIKTFYYNLLKTGTIVKETLKPPHKKKKNEI